ncbi:MAG: TonB-dependent receptor plug domain-containing protein [Allosphingosinicella sp.]|uniref:TonB-dependent receptor plug domain-containing protein n=1 Tax=Allosphingosinicella sp. TaxID=2823234 RepID=UPI00395B6203
MTTRATLLLTWAATWALWAVSPATAYVSSSGGPEEREHAAEEEEVIIVQGTRTRRSVQDEPIRVEVITREEIEEKLLMRPGNIAMLLNETGGVRVQVTSPALGASNIRIQGMEGRYTHLLADGLPLYGGQASSLGILQIAPTDLNQVEVIKGAASALYGPSALGGVINLISRRPADFLEAEVLANATTRNGQDLTAYLSSPLGGGWSASLTGGAHRQGSQDLDDDGWIDMPFYERFTARPRLFWEGTDGASAFLTLGVMSEQRVGGTSPGRTAPDGRPFLQAQDTDRLDAGLVAGFPVAGVGTLHLRSSGMKQEHRHVFGDVVELDRHATVFGEVSLAGEEGATAWVAGVAHQVDSFRSGTFPVFNYTHDVPGVFGQIQHEATPELTLAGSARLDFHNEYGAKFSPRLSVLYRPWPWTIRASFGRGFYAPTPFIEEVEAAGLARLESLGELEAETAETVSLDIGYARGPVEASVTLFASDIDAATRLVPIAADRVRLINASGRTRIRGSELLLRYRWDEFTVTGSYVYAHATEPVPTGAGRRRASLTPRHSAGVVAMWEEHGKGRIGVEAYYTGRQTLEDNPFRTSSRPYLHLGVLAEIVVGKVSLFANAENILDVRQTGYDPLLLPQRAPSGQWTTDIWAPTEGFILNAGIRMRFGGER